MGGRAGDGGSDDGRGCEAQAVASANGRAGSSVVDAVGRWRVEGKRCVAGTGYFNKMRKLH